MFSTKIRTCSLTVIFALLTLSCAKTEPSKPGQARTCEELVQIGRNIAELVLEEIEEKELSKIQEQELNKTIKIRRKQINENWASVIEDMYSE